MNGYFDQPEQTAQALHPEGWFRAGDMGYLDAERYLYLCGRKKDLIIRGGENIYPIEIEQVIHEFPGVLECAVVGMPDEHWGELPRAHIVLASGATIPDSDQLRAFCRGRLASYKVPVAWVFESELPRNASGKILKRSLLDTASERR
jgi:acyl-CoA synthetase (AMP-forming)/AMP-acid ligase II